VKAAFLGRRPSSFALSFACRAADSILRHSDLKGVLGGMTMADIGDVKPAASGPEIRQSGALIWLGVVALVYLLLVGVSVIGDGFSSASGGRAGAAAIFEFAANPLVAVILGVLATALVQSSSAVTSVIVGLVAGGVPLATAIPMIMGANMGTTITNTFVSLGSIRDKKEFGRAFQAATVHDFFNLLSIVVLLPIELIFHPLQALSGAMVGFFMGDANLSMRELNFMRTITRPVSDAIGGLFDGFGTVTGGIIAIAVGIAMVIGAVMVLGKLLKSVMTGRAKEWVNWAIGRGPVAGIASGTVVTIVVQSSSTTTSLVVPLAANGTLTTKQIFPFTMGANIGTTITAILAATAVSGPNADIAMQVAIVHLLYNLAGVLAFTLIPVVKDLPVNMAQWLGDLCEKNRLWAFGYIVAVFFVLPGLVFAAQALTIPPDPLIEAAEEKVDLQQEVDKEINDADVVIE
jgi:sodium-dependent phosphate cotransporter